MAVNLYFWVGLVLCLCAMIILTYTFARVKTKTANKNITINQFIMLIGSDTVSTLITGILLLRLGTADNYVDTTIKSTTEIKCTTSQLLMKLSAYLIPVLTGMASVPSWMFQLYKCVDCNETHEKYQASYHNKKTIAIIISQWVMPIVSILLTLMTEPDIIHVKNPQSFNMIESAPMLTIDTGESFCGNFENASNTRVERFLSEDLRGLLINKKNVTSMIVNRIYNIVKHHGEKNLSYNDENQLNNPTKPSDMYPDPQKDLYENEKVNGSTNLTINKNATTTHFFNNIADIILNNKQNASKQSSNVSKKDDDNGDELLMGLNTLTNINILELMENYTWKNEDGKEITMTNNYYNKTDIDNNFCFMACHPSKGFLKKLFFLILLLNVFLPLVITATLQAMMNKKMEIMELKEQQHVEYMKHVANILLKKTVIGMTTLSPTLIDSVIRTLLSIDMPQHLSAVLLALAMAGTATRNLMGLYLIDAMQNTNSSVHPIEEDQSSVGENNKTIEVKQKKEQQLKVHNIENQIKNQETTEEIK